MLMDVAKAVASVAPALGVDMQALRELVTSTHEALVSSGYWCSSGSHAVGQSVTWTGILNSRRVALGVKVNWAYAPV